MNFCATIKYIEIQQIESCIQIHVNFWISTRFLTPGESTALAIFPPRVDSDIYIIINIFDQQENKIDGSLDLFLVCRIS